MELKETIEAANAIIRKLPSLGYSSVYRESRERAVRALLFAAALIGYRDSVTLESMTITLSAAYELAAANEAPPTEG